MGNPEEIIVVCAGCGAKVTELAGVSGEKREGCPSCGSTVRHCAVVLSDTLRLHAAIGTKHRNLSNKVLAETLSGDDLHRKSAKWMRKERIIDHANDRYKEVVIDPESGEIVHHQDHHLTEHRGHGDDKTNRRPEN